MDREQPDVAARIMLRPIATPLPLGLLALGGASIVVSGLQLSWLPVSSRHQVALVVLAFTVPAQLVAAVFGFLSRDAVGGTGMSILGGTWLTVGLLELTSPPGATSRTLGLLLFFASAAVIVPVAGATLGKLLVASVFLMASVRFALAGVYQFGGGAAMRSASGWLGVALAVVSIYSALAFELEGIRHKHVLPVLRWGAGRRAVTGTLVDQLDQANREPGVRQQL